MFLTIALVLLVLWALGVFVFPMVGALIYILLVLAIISILWHFIARPSRRV
ncbi:MAG: lmo0937 family membrane protein [Gemmatimonadaceae bacterium]